MKVKDYDDCDGVGEGSKEMQKAHERGVIGRGGFSDATKGEIWVVLTVLAFWAAVLAWVWL